MHGWQRGGGCALGGQGVSQPPAGWRGCPVRTVAERRGCPGSAPGGGEAVCRWLLPPCRTAFGLHPSQPLAERAGQEPPSQTSTEAGTKKSDVEVQGHPQILECMGGTSHPDRPPGHPTTDLSICGPIPPSCRCGRQPGQVSGKQVAACGLGQAPCRKGEMRLAYINMDKTGRADVCHGDHTPR